MLLTLGNILSVLFMNALLFIPHEVPMASVTLYQTATI